MTATERDRVWPFWPALPIYPYGRRRTLRREVLPETIWTFDQLQGIFYVVVPVRMTVVKLAEGGLLVYSPVAPTGECIGLLRELEAAHGAVKYIVLSTLSGLEHKVFVGPFARQCPHAQVYVTPGQWSFPLNLPLSWLGFPGGRTQRLPEDSGEVPFADEFDYARLGPIRLGLGPFGETALLHRASKTLLTTDTILSLPEEPPEIALQEPYPLLFHARDRAQEPITDSPERRRIGWQRMCLFAFYFQPSALEVVELGEALREARESPERSRQAYFGLFPFRWPDDSWRDSFARLRQEGRPFVAPILQKLILNRDIAATLTWVDRVASWEFERVVPCHLDAPVAIGPAQFRDAFAFLSDPSAPRPFPSEEYEFLDNLEERLVTARIAPPPERSI